VPNFYTWRREAMAPRAVPSRALAWPARAKHIKARERPHYPKAVHITMLTGEPRAENRSRPALFSLPADVPALVMRAGELLKGSGCKDAAIEVYEQFIRGLQRCAMCSIQAAIPGTSPAGTEKAAEKLPDLFPVHAHPERYTLA